MSKVQIEISIGIIVVLITGVVLVTYGLNENQRMEQFALAQNAQSVEVGAALFETNCTGCHGPQGQGIPGLCPPLNDRNFFDNRMKEVGWGGTIEDYIVSTVSAGRLVSTRPDQYPGGGKPAMPAWSETYGGPLRNDQIRDIASYILNWESTAGQVITATQETTGPAAGTDITVALPQGDPAKGEKLATQHGCVACHVTAPVGPAWMASGDQPGIGTRATTRFTEPGYTGHATSSEQYLFESIVNPSAFIVPNFQDQMPKNFGEILSLQDVADLIAYLMTLK
jgi:mono/diheme cytochrome c family protein